MSAPQGFLVRYRCCQRHHDDGPGRSGDGGIDGLGVYQLSLLSFPVFFQCKRYRGTVDAGAVRDFRDTMAGRGDKGLFITTGNFTAEARSEASRDGAPPIDLIDGQRLCDLLKQYDPRSPHHNPSSRGRIRRPRARRATDEVLRGLHLHLQLAVELGHSQHPEPRQIQHPRRQPQPARVVLLHCCRTASVPRRRSAR